MCFTCDSYDAHHVGHIHRPGKKVVRRHNGRLVTERLRRPLLHLNDGSEFVGYCNHPRFGHVSTLGEYRRRGRSGPLRLPVRVPGHGMWGNENEGYYARGPGMMRRGNSENEYTPHAMFEQRMPAFDGGCGHGQGQGVGNSFHNGHHQQGRGHGQHQHPGQNCRRYTTNDGMSGMVEEREPGRGNGDGYHR